MVGRRYRLRRRCRTYGSRSADPGGGPAAAAIGKRKKTGCHDDRRNVLGLCHVLFVPDWINAGRCLAVVDIARISEKPLLISGQPDSAGPCPMFATAIILRLYMDRPLDAACKHQHSGLPSVAGIKRYHVGVSLVRKILLL